jgi:membrane protease YdiL (CAAX protease family)
LSGPGEPGPPAEPDESNSPPQPVTDSVAGEVASPVASDVIDPITGLVADPTVDGTVANQDPARPGARVFSLEGRAAPGLYLIGWLASIVGIALIIVASLAGGGVAAVILLLAGLVAMSAGLIGAAGAQAIQRKVEGRLGYAGPSPVLVLAAAIVTANLLALVVAVIGRPFGLRGATPVGALVGLLVSAAVNVGLIRLLVVGTGALSWEDMAIRRPSRLARGDIVLGAVLGVAVLYLTALLAVALLQVLAQPPPQLPEATNASGRLATFVAAALVAPISEEIFFRGFVTTAWARTSSPRRAIIQGGLLFAFIHVLTLGGPTFVVGAQWALFAFLVRLPVSFSVGWIFMYRRSIYASVALHVTFNGLPLLVAYLR